MRARILSRMMAACGLAGGLALVVVAFELDRIRGAAYPWRFGGYQIGLLAAGLLVMIAGFGALLACLGDHGRQSRASNGLLAGFSLLVVLIVCEAIVRGMGYVGDDGQFYWRGRPIRPYRMPITWTRRTLEEYAATPTSYQMYDPYLGWTIRPNSQSADGLYRSNANGVRAD